MRIRFALTAALLALATEAQSQRVLQGLVTDSAGAPLPNVEARTANPARVTRTDARGRFVFEHVSDSVVDVTLRRLGYQVRSLRVSMTTGEADSLRVVMQAEPVQLDTVTTDATEDYNPAFDGYHRRKALGIGSFITHQDLEKQKPLRLSDAFRRVPGMDLIPVGSGLGVRFRRNSGLRGSQSASCAPTVFLDGSPAQGLEVDELSASDTYAIEIYRGPATIPTEYRIPGMTSCGIIVVWTKRRIR
jgi:hypothetical protein